MTCKDCIHLTDEKNTQFPDMENLQKCIVAKVDVWVEPSCEPCELFVSKDGTYHNGTEHCPRCGRPVPKWGLCDECSRLYDSWDEVSK